MNNFLSAKRFKSLLDEAAADHAGLGQSNEEDATLGPCVGGDAAPIGRSVTTLGPSVGDDGISPDVTMLGACVGDDNKHPLTTLGPCIGDDFSDVRLKEDVQRIGTTVFGLPLYRFKYVGRSETHEGVMAQDVLDVMPSAVSRGEDGYYRVNYSALGTSMRRVS
jgi:hypothetical protein